MRMFRIFVFVLLSNIAFTSFSQLIKLPVKKDMFHLHKAKHIDFIENKGQWNTQVLFRAELSEGTVFLENDRFVFALLNPKQHESFFGYKMLDFETKQKTTPPSPVIDAHAYSMSFVGTTNNPDIQSIEKLPFYLNYYLGNNPEHWASNVGAFHSVKYKNLYQGIDMYVYENEGLFKHDFIIHPDAEPSRIKIKYEGINKTELESGNLIIRTTVNSMLQLKPYAYQIINGDTIAVTCNFELKNNILSYRFPNSYNKDFELIIDPVLVFGSYSGSTAHNWGYTATYDQMGNLYAGGSVFNIGYPTTLGAYQINFGGGACDIAISKYNSSGATLEYSTYLGGTGSEVPQSLIVNSLNELYVYGTTGSSDFPMSGNSYDNSFNGGAEYTLTYIIQYPNGSDIALSRFNSSGTQLLSSTYLGGSGNDGLNMYAPLKNNYADDCRGEVLLDENDNVYIVSATSSSDFPVSPGVFQQTYGGGELDGCVIKMDNQLSSVLWASYVGGSGIDATYSITLDDNNNPTIAGGTTSTDLVTTSGAVFSTNSGGTCDGYIMKISQNGSQIMASTYWGTPVYDQIYFVQHDQDNNIYVLGQTKDNSSLLHYNAIWFNPGGGQFISKLSPNLTSILWSTVFGTGGGTVNISPTAFLVDYCNNIYLSGWGSPSLNGFGGTSGLPVTSNAFQQTTDNNDYYFMAITDDASELVYATYYGGAVSREHVDGGTSRFDRSGKIYQSVCAGCGGQSDFPTTVGAWSNTNNSSNCNNGVVKIDFQLPVLVASFSTSAPVCLPGTVHFYNNSNVPGPGQMTCFWDFGDGNTSDSFNPSHTYQNPGIYNVMLAVQDLTSCNQNDTTFRQVMVLNNTIDTLDTVEMCVGQSLQIGVLPYVGQDITYQWIPDQYITNNAISNPFCSAPATTEYMLLVSVGVCTDTLYQTVHVYEITADAGPDTLICQVNHTLHATSTGGGTNILYHWSTNMEFTDTLNNSPQESDANITVSQSGWYYVKIYNSDCYDIDSVFINITQFNTNFSSIKPLCHGDCNGSITVFTQGGNSPYIYNWSNGFDSQTITGVCAGTYLVTVTDKDGCQNLNTFTLIEPSELQLQLTTTAVPCLEACNGAVISSVNGGTFPYTYQWSNGLTSAQLTPVCSGQYSLTLTDNNGCKLNQSAEVQVNNIYQNMQVWADEDTIWKGETANLYATFLNGVSYSWTPATWMNTPSENQTGVMPPPGTWTFYINVDNGQGCVYTDSLQITVLDVMCREPYVFIPNAFTPDNDGFNDVLYVRSLFIEKMNLQVFDRWGNQVFETDKQDFGWDGTYNGKPAEAGVYAYTLRITCFGNTEFNKKGNITLIR